jgi:hypothetical protein
MELASMLAHEPFSDRPHTVCPVISAFLRAYNDWIDDRRRQDLYVYASRIVDTKEGKTVERARADLCLEWSRSTHQLPHLRFPLWSGLYRKKHECETAAAWAARIASQAVDDELHHKALSLIDQLIAVGSEQQTGDLQAHSDQSEVVTG